jgi:hypothetical protein
MLVGMVNTTVCVPLEESDPALEMVIGNWERRLLVSGPSEAHIPGIRSTTLPVEYGINLHSIVHV